MIKKMVKKNEFFIDFLLGENKNDDLRKYAWLVIPEDDWPFICFTKKLQGDFYQIHLRYESQQNRILEGSILEGLELTDQTIEPQNETIISTVVHNLAIVNCALGLFNNNEPKDEMLIEKRKKYIDILEKYLS